MATTNEELAAVEAMLSEGCPNTGPFAWEQGIAIARPTKSAEPVRTIAEEGRDDAVSQDPTPLEGKAD